VERKFMTNTFKARSFLALATLSLGLALCTCAAAAPLPRCSSGLTPTHAVAPVLPPRQHNEFTGEAKVALVISRDGSVQSPEIVSSEWHPIGRSPAKPIGYHEAILAAVSQWQFPPMKHACRHQFPIEFELEEPGKAKT